MFPPENDEGNIEYKRHLCSEELKSLDMNYNIRFQQLVTQMKYRLGEGNGIAVYYIGVEDDGSIYKLSKDQRRISLLVLKKMTLFLDASIESTFFNDKYVKCIIKDKWKSKILPEKRILILGDTETGKTTFLAYLIKNKLDRENCKSRLFILNHKHELETGKTSSFNYQYKDYKGEKYVFIDTPGDDVLFSKTNKIRNKIILCFNFDLIIFMNKKGHQWSKRELFVYYASFLNIPFIDFDLFDAKSEINLINPKPQNEIIDLIKMKIINSKRNMLIQHNKSLINFYLLQCYPHIDMGWILSGFLSSGTLETGQELLWYDYDKIPVKINTIYQNNAPVKSINGPATITITLNHINNMNNKPRFGFLSNINYLDVTYVKVVWIYFSDSRILSENEINVSIKNQNIILKKMNGQSKYMLKNPTYSYNIINQIFIYEKDKFNAFGKLVKYM